jgi:hypothetical protein
VADSRCADCCAKNNAQTEVWAFAVVQGKIEKWSDNQNARHAEYSMPGIGVYCSRNSGKHAPVAGNAVSGFEFAGWISVALVGVHVP